MESSPPEYTAELLRHFADLRDGTHGGAVSRQDKERFFTAAVALLDPHARQPLTEINADLLLGTGEVTATGVRHHRDGIDAIWALSWPEQQAAQISPVIIRAHYGAGAQRTIGMTAGVPGFWNYRVTRCSAGAWAVTALDGAPAFWGERMQGHPGAHPPAGGTAGGFWPRATERAPGAQAPGAGPTRRIPGLARKSDPRRTHA
jgi:hypothetical protein